MVAFFTLFCEMVYILDFPFFSFYNYLRIFIKLQKYALNRVDLNNIQINIPISK